MYIYNSSKLTSLANIIRTKTNTTEKMYPREMADKINSINVTSTTPAITKAEYMSGIENLEDIEITSMNDYFNFDLTLKSVNLPNATSIISNAFRGCLNLKNVNVPKLQIYSGQFASCSNLEELRLPAVTTIKIGFECGAKLLDLGPELTTTTYDQTYGSIFYDLPNLETLIIRSTKFNINIDTDVNQRYIFDAYSPMANGTGFIYVPQESLSKYSSKYPFSLYKSQLRAIEDYPDICGE